MVTKVAPPAMAASVPISGKVCHISFTGASGSFFLYSTTISATKAINPIARGTANNGDPKPGPLSSPAAQNGNMVAASASMIPVRSNGMAGLGGSASGSVRSARTKMATPATPSAA